MLKDRYLLFHSYLNSLDDFQYLLYFLKVQCAPTRAGLKTGTMLNLGGPSGTFFRIWKDNRKRLLENLGLQGFTLKETDSSALVLFYDEKAMDAHLKEEEVRDFLNEFGYLNCKGCKEYFLTLREHFRNRCPDEVGVFLGYPLEDIRSFHCEGGGACLATGYWQCYHNVEDSLLKFKMFDETRKSAMDRILCRKA